MSILQYYVQSNSRYVKILIDIGASPSIIHKFKTKKTSAHTWSTMSGSFLTSCEAEIKIKLPELNFSAEIFVPFHISSQKSNYNVIIVRDLLRVHNYVGWKETNIPMKSINRKMRTNFANQESKNIKSATNRIEKI